MTPEHPGFLKTLGRLAGGAVGLEDPNSSPQANLGARIGALVGRIGAAGALAAGTPEQKSIAAEQLQMPLKMAQIQNEREYRQGMLGINQQNANSKSETADIRARQATAGMRVKGYVPDEDNPGQFRAMTSEEILADPILSQNRDLKYAAVAAKNAQSALMEARRGALIDPNSLTQRNLLAAREQTAKIANARLAMERLELEKGNLALQNTITNQGNERLDRSFQFNQGELGKLRTPIDQRATRLANLTDSINQNSPQADSLIAPELLTTMAGGAGSGLRMNEAEISRIVGGRDKWESLKAAVNAWQLDPTKPFSITPEQRIQVRNLMAVVNSRLAAKQSLLDSAGQALVDAGTPEAHRQILQNVHTQLDGIDSLSDQAAMSRAGAAGVTATRPGGTNAGGGSTPSSNKSVSLAAARQLPAMTGLTDDQIRAAIVAQGHKVAP